MVSLPDRQLGSQLSDIPSVYNGGFSRPLLGLADALPPMRLPCGIWNNRRTKSLPFYRNLRKAAQSRFSVPKILFRPADLIFRTL